jgi:hypothetical protein
MCPGWTAAIDVTPHRRTKPKIPLRPGKRPGAYADTGSNRRGKAARLRQATFEPSESTAVDEARAAHIRVYAERHPTDTGNIAAQALGWSVEVVKAALANPGAQQDR